MPAAGAAEKGAGSSMAAAETVEAGMAVAAMAAMAAVVGVVGGTEVEGH